MSCSWLSKLPDEWENIILSFSASKARSPPALGFNVAVARVCSLHFVDGRPSKLHPIPSLGIPGNTPEVRESEVQVVDTWTPDNNTVEECKLRYNVCKLELETAKLKQTVADLEDTVTSHKREMDKLLFSYGRIKGNSSRVSFYTGFCDSIAFESFFQFLEPMAQKLDYRGTEKLKARQDKPGPHRKLAPIDEFLMTCMRLKVGLLEDDLAERFQASKVTVSRTVNTWLCLLHCVVTDISWWMEREEVDAHMPIVFHNLGYSDVRIVLDATEIPINKPSHPQLQRSTWSEYKQTNTLKGLVGISPNGFVTFVSKLFGGCISDTELTLRSGLLEQLSPGDAITADRGFDMRHETSKRGIRLFIPPFTKGRKQLSYIDAEDTKSIASLRIDVERVIRRIKSFHILDSSPLPLDLIPVADKIWSVCAFMTNFQTPLRSRYSRQPHSVPGTMNRRKHDAPSPVSVISDMTPTQGDDLTSTHNDTIDISYSTPLSPTTSSDTVHYCPSTHQIESCAVPHSRLHKHPVPISPISPAKHSPISLPSTSTEALLPWRNLLFQLSSGLYFNSCAYDTAFHCLGAIYNLIHASNIPYLLNKRPFDYKPGEGGL